MKRIVTVILASLIVSPALAERVSQMVDAAPNGLVDISNIAGSVTVSGWSRNNVEVTGSIGRDVKELIVERDGNTVTIKVRVPSRGGRSIASRLHINVPRNSSLDVGTVSANIDVTEISGEQELRTVSGDVNTEYTGADMKVESVSGDIEISGNSVDGEIEVRTVSGDLTLFRVGGILDVHTVSGDIIVDEGDFSRADLSSVTGDMVFQAALHGGGRLNIDAVNSNINVDFPGDVSARFEIDTFNGGIRNCFGPEAKRTGRYAPGWELVFTEGTGDGRVQISTVNGNVNICRK